MANIQTRKGPNGTTVYRVQIRRKGQPAQSATFTTKSQARRWAQVTEGNILSGRRFPDTKHTVADAIDRYLAEVLPHKRPSTIPGQARQLRWWRQKIGHTMLGDVTPAMVAKMRDDLVRQASNSTSNRYLGALSHVFTVAVKEWGWALDNPCLKVRRMREPRGRVRFLSDDERHRLLAECRASRSPHLYTLVVLALSTGARKGELVGLRWADVDLDRGTLTFNDTKNGDRRSVPLVGHALDLLRALPRGAGLVFLGPQAGHRTNFQHGWDAAVKRAGLKDVVFHTLRHSAASYLAMSGVSLIEIGHLLGHKTAAMTFRYSHLSPGHLHGLASRLDATLFG